MQILIKNKDTLLCDEFTFKCCIGKKGSSFNKLEGDKKTPKGTFSIGPLFYRADKVDNLITKLKKRIIKKNMGWCDDVNSVFYNKLIKIKKKEKTKYEKMYRKDDKYDIVIPIHYNSFNPKKNKGSAIFIHLTKNYSKTLGCVGLKKKDMLVLIKIITDKTKIKII